jgi:hypothetical protein
MEPPIPGTVPTTSYAERAARAEAARRGADKRVILDPNERRSQQIATTITPPEAQRIRQVAREQHLSASDYVRLATLLVLDSGLDLGDTTLVGKPTTLARLERQAKQQGGRKGTTPDPKALPRHCDRAMTLTAGVMLECPVCGLTLLRDAT